MCYFFEHCNAMQTADMWEMCKAKVKLNILKVCKYELVIYSYAVMF